MSQAVVLKSNKYGIDLMLDSEMPFDKLLDAIGTKFQEASKFFGNAQVAVSFEGRKLSAEEERRIIETITENSGIDILCIVDRDRDREQALKAQIDAYLASPAENNADFFRGTLRSGQVLNRTSSVVIVGDVNPGATIISEGNIVVLGSLKGNAYAGAAGNTGCFIIALDMDPIQVQIGDILAKSPDPDRKKTPAKSTRRRAKAPAAAEPQIALARGGDIYIEPLQDRRRQGTEK